MDFILIYNLYLVNLFRNVGGDKGENKWGKWEGYGMIL